MTNPLECNCGYAQGTAHFHSPECALFDHSHQEGEKNRLTNISEEEVAELEKSGANITRLENQESEWEKEYEEIWENACLPGYADDCREDVKRLIRQTLSKQKSSLVELIGGLKKEIPTYVNKRGHHTNSAHRKIKYNQALDDVLALLKRD